MARSRARRIGRRQRLLILRGTWLACAFRRFASLLVLGASLLASWSAARLGHETCRENDFVYPPPRVSARRGTTRSVVEGAGSLRASSHLPLPAPSRPPPPPARGRKE